MFKFLQIQKQKLIIGMRCGGQGNKGRSGASNNAPSALSPTTHARSEGVAPSEGIEREREGNQHAWEACT